MARRTLRIRKGGNQQPLNTGSDEPNGESGNDNPVDGTGNESTDVNDSPVGETVIPDNASTFDPAAATDPGGSGEPGGDSEPDWLRRFRSGGRKRRTSSNPAGRKQRKASGSQNIEKILYGCHAMLATLIQCPELAIAEKEAEDLSAAIAQVNALYDMPVVPEWVVAWSNLVFVAGTIYGPRGLAIWNRKEQEKASKATNITHPSTINKVESIRRVSNAEPASPSQIDGSEPIN